MTNVIDITEILISREKKAWYDTVLFSLEASTTEKERRYWLEIKLALEFEEYYKQTGEYHEKDPLNLDTDCYLI